MALRRCLRLFLTVLILVLLLPLNACAVESPASSSAPSATADAPPTPDPRPTPASSKGPARNLPRPVLPESAKQNTKEGFEAFTQYWFDTITYALETGDSAPLKESSLPDCKICNDYIERSASLKTSGSWAVGPIWKTEDIQVDMRADSRGQISAYFFLIEADSVEYSTDGSVRKTTPRSSSEDPFSVRAIHQDLGWRIAEVKMA
ncbi:DUF6318 family protein [Sinomonas gamaensis]|uniref:DUF6318 family protein n=1 Tax=Sinomonas gamaensis TaxID=2565624 RepID=UPI003B8399F6